jgi:predicted component of type VI protein secretion system
MSNSNQKANKKIDSKLRNKSLVESINQNIEKPLNNQNKQEFIKFLISQKKKYQSEKLKLMVTSIGQYDEENILAIASVDRSVHVQLKKF